MIIAADHLTVRYPAAPRRALDGVSLTLAKGELVAVVGPNGSGKTTLLQALLGVVPHESGTVRINERPIGEWRRPELARVIGVVTQREEPAFSLMVGFPGPLSPSRSDRASASPGLGRGRARTATRRRASSRRPADRHAFGRRMAAYPSSPCTGPGARGPGAG